MTERLKALNDGDTIDFIANSSPKCPHCAAIYEIARNEAWHLYEEGDHEITCGSCGLEFIVDTRVEYSFNTDEQDEE